MDSPPFATRSEHDEDAVWSSLTGTLLRYEIRTPPSRAAFQNPEESSGCIHFGRLSLLLRIARGGHLSSSPSQVMEKTLEKAKAVLEKCANTSRPSDAFKQVISWLEHEQESGFLSQCYTTATIVAVVGDKDIWSWHTSPQGIVSGSKDSLHFKSTDLRYPELIRQGLMKSSPLQLEDTEIRDKASSVFCLGTQDGYEFLRQKLGSEVCVFLALDRALLPFGSWPAVAVSSADLWSMDSAWRHGMAGIGLFIGSKKVDFFELPTELNILELPM